MMRETEDLMEELNATVTKHVRKARARRNSSPQFDKFSTNIDSGCSVPMIRIPTTSVANPPYMPSMPAL